MAVPLSAVLLFSVSILLYIMFPSKNKKLILNFSKSKISGWKAIATEARNTAARGVGRPNAPSRGIFASSLTSEQVGALYCYAVTRNPHRGPVSLSSWLCSFLRPDVLRNRRRHLPSAKFPSRRCSVLVGNGGRRSKL